MCTTWLATWDPTADNAMLVQKEDCGGICVSWFMYCSVAAYDKDKAVAVMKCLTPLIAETLVAKGIIMYML